MAVDYIHTEVEDASGNRALMIEGISEYGEIVSRDYIPIIEVE